ncbi:hypothetical protein RhiirC2_779191 [Rhizophagus irregularis]|uniref:DEAD/DEAH-box helicase domain-containing protein n=1 Tax=Rhizophagus irregularis TaxID=588596 RepID=A0A2N1NAG3_9GLOM|nr:hypothetical protein RhiirC2_779191 [Rhizophagus irregularis]
MTNEARKEKFANDRKEFAGFNFDKELVLYKSKTPDQIHKDIFWPSFGNILRDFDIIVKCVACYAFAKKRTCNLYGICSFYVDVNKSLMINIYLKDNNQSHLMEMLISYYYLSQKTLLDLIIFEKARNHQIEVIIVYLNGKDTFVSMKTDGGKTLCYAISAICFKGLTIIFSPFKAFMND